MKYKIYFFVVIWLMVQFATVFQNYVYMLIFWAPYLEPILIKLFELDT